MEKENCLEEIEWLKQELEKVKSQFYIFYELTQAIQTTLRLDEVAYIILTGLTARQGLEFNRAILFLIDEAENAIKGFTGIGPIDAEEANRIWDLIEKQKMDLYSLIEVYRKIKEGNIRPKLMEFTHSLSFPLNEKSGLIYESLHEVVPIYIDGAKYKEDPLVEKLNLKEFVIAPLWSKNNPLGVIIVDNYITQKPITEENIKILTMFINQAARAIENSKTYENTLLRAHTDLLTSLWNYGYFQYKLDEELIKAKRHKEIVSVIMLDLDDFKKFNDSFGHPAGDQALKEIAENLKKCTRATDIVSRYGGEEFALILPNTSKKDCLVVAEQIRSFIEKQKILNYFFTVSIGVSTFPEDSQDKKQLIQKADLALYRAKNEGKNRIVST